MKFLVFALAALDAVSASIVERAYFDTKDVWTRPEGDANQVADLCHPNLKEGEKWQIPGYDVPPCLSEQFISKECEEITGTGLTKSKEKPTNAQWKGLQQCLTGKSSFYADVTNCMGCKEHYKYFSPEQYKWFMEKWKLGWDIYRDEVDPVGAPWTYVLAQIGCGECVRKDQKNHGKNIKLTGWACFTSLAGGRHFTEAKRKALGDPKYVTKPYQNINTFTFNGTTYTEPVKRIQKRSDGNSLFKVTDIARCDDVESTDNNTLSQCRGADIFIQKSGKGFVSTTVVEEKTLDLITDDSEINNIEEVPQQLAGPILAYMEETVGNVAGDE